MNFGRLVLLALVFSSALGISAARANSRDSSVMSDAYDQSVKVVGAAKPNISRDELREHSR